MHWPRVVSQHHVLMCSDNDPAAAQAGPSSRPQKRKGVAGSSDDVTLVVSDGAGPSKRARASAQPQQLDGDIAVISDHTRNPNRDLPHRREACATHQFLQVASRDNSAFCDKVRPVQHMLLHPIMFLECL